MRLIDAPVGVFRFDNELVLKTEYSKKYGSVYCPECYILSSGEMFWGGMKTIEDFETKYNYLEVEPVNINLGQESTIHPEPHYDEWCDSCKEYDKEKHSCPRWNKVIKNTVDELKSAQPELCEDAVSRLGAISHFRRIADATSSKEEYNEGFVDGLKFCIAHLSTMPTVTPKQKWIPVTKRLPEVKQKVLVQYADESMATKRCNDAGHLQWFYANAVAWMPALEPWEGDAE